MPSSHLTAAPALPLASLPIHSEDDEIPEVLSRFTCAVCPEIGEESWPDADEYNDVMGKKLRDARIAPDGQWVCSQPCVSQLMFQNASVEEKSALQRYEVALSDLQSSAGRAETLLKKWGCFHDIKPHTLETAQFMLGAMERRQPKKREVALWIEETASPEETLRTAVGKAVHDLDWRAQNELRSDIDFLHRMVEQTNEKPSLPKLYTAQYTTKAIASALGTIGRVITSLKAALAGEVSQ